MLDKWEVSKEESSRYGTVTRYGFYSKAGDFGNPGITELSISTYDLPVNSRTEIHVRARNIQLYNNIVDAGRQHAATIQDPQSFYFDSIYNSFERMNDAVRQRLLSNRHTVESFLGSKLSHCDPFDKDNLHYSMDKIDESLNVLASVDPNVLEIIDYMKDEFGLSHSHVLK